MEARGEIDKVARNAKNEGKMLYDEEGYVITNLTENKHQQQAPMDHAKAAPRKNTKVPQAVLESMMSNPIDTSPLNGGMEGNGSILDMMGLTEQIKENSERLMGMPQKRQQPTIREQAPVGAVDYQLIGNMIEETVRKYAKALSKRMLNESKDGGSNISALKLGDTFSFITENGDLYEATLTFKRNIAKKR
jgi:hypothetical protein